MTRRYKQFGIVYVNHGDACIMMCDTASDVRSWLVEHKHEASAKLEAQLDALRVKELHRESYLNTRGATYASWFVIRLW